MSRPRAIHPSLWEDKEFASLSYKARVLFVACFSNADDDGRLSAAPKALSYFAYRYDKISDKAVLNVRNEISYKMKSFLVYRMGEFEYIQLLKWEDYQTQKEERRKGSILPAPTAEQIASQMSDKCLPSGGQMSPQDKLSKVKLSKDKLSPEVLSLANFLKDLILKNNPKAVMKTGWEKRWANEARLMNEQDGIAIADIKTAIEKAQADKSCRGDWKGWSAVILSMSNVRKHFNKLIALKLGGSPSGKITGAATPIEGKYADLCKK
jgi:hypothetical protein